MASWGFVSGLWPTSARGGAYSRYASLLVFVATTYAAAHVGGFAWVLVILGIAQVRPAHAFWRLAYLGVLGVVILYQLEPLDFLIAILH